MRILHLIGNGFDKAQGLNTSYPEFYSWLHSQSPLDAFEEKIHNEIKGNYATWADLEIALGQYSNKFTDPNEFRSVIRYFNTRLKEYLAKENERVKSMGLSKDKLISDLCVPQRCLEGQGKVLYKKVLEGFKDNVLIDIVTFNYTSTFEYVRGARKDFGVHDSRYYQFNNLLHIHGLLEDMILIGVDNEEQIANTAFRDNPFIRYEFIKPSINEGCQNTNNAALTSLIKTADVIVLFGVSIGLTDKTWWRLIGERMDDQFNQPLLLFFPFDPSKDTRLSPNYKLLWSDEYIAFLKDRMEIKASVEHLKQSICVGINKDFLKLI